MTDRLEQELHEVLTRHAGAAPAAHGLAAAARGRARRRRRARLGAVAAATVLAVGVPTAVLAGSGSEPQTLQETSRHDPSATTRAHRWESWHGVSVRVPNRWGWGSLGTWCTDGGAAGPRVQRPGQAVGDRLCTPASTYGVSFQAADRGDDYEWPVVAQSGDAWPQPNAVGGRALGGVLITVAAPKSEIAQEVLDSAYVNVGEDPNDCVVRLRDGFLRPPSGMAVCRYDPDGLLEQSELLTGADAEAAAAAIDAAPRGQLDCEPSGQPPVTIRMTDAERYISLVLDGACTAFSGHPSGLQSRELMRWALSPGWSGDPTGLLIPAVPRQE